MNRLFTSFENLFQLFFGIKIQRYQLRSGDVQKMGKDEQGRQKYLYTFVVSENNGHPAPHMSRHHNTPLHMNATIKQTMRHNKQVAHAPRPRLNQSAHKMAPREPSPVARFNQRALHHIHYLRHIQSLADKEIHSAEVPARLAGKTVNTPNGKMNVTPENYKRIVSLQTEKKSLTQQIKLTKANLKPAAAANRKAVLKFHQAYGKPAVNRKPVSKGIPPIKSHPVFAHSSDRNSINNFLTNKGAKRLETVMNSNKHFPRK